MQIPYKKLRNTGIVLSVLIAAGLIIVHILPVDKSLFVISLFELAGGVSIGAIAALIFFFELNKQKLSNREFKAEKDFSDVVINSLPGLFYMFDADGKIIKWNRNAEIVTGYSPEEISAMNAIDFFEESSHETMHEAIQGVFENGVGEIEVEFKRKSGGTITHYLSGKKVMIDGKSYLAGMAVDITERKHAEEELEKNKKKLEDHGYNLEKLVAERSADLEKSKRKLEGILNASKNIAIMTTDLNGIFTLFNPGAENISGYTSGELVGKSTPNLLFDEKRLDDFAAAQEYVLKRPVGRDELFSAEVLPHFTEELEAIAVRKDGRKVNLLLNFSQLLDEEGRTTGSLCVAVDITARKSAERALSDSEKKYRMITDNITDVIWVRDLETFEAQYISPACEKVFGYSSEEMMETPLTSLITPDSFVDISTLAAEELALENDPDRSASAIRVFELEHYRKDGTTIWVEVRAAFLRDTNDKAVAFIGVSRDISERKAFEEQLKQAKKSAEAANIAKGEFLANMSHEIRTPMNAIIGMSELIMSTDMTRKQRDFLKIIRTSSKALLYLINDILDFSKIEAGKLTLENVPLILTDLVEEIPDVFVENIMESTIEVILNIAPETPDNIVTDPVRLRQVLINLVSNAFKFTEDGQISISVSSKGVTGDTAELLFCVSDTGIGFDSEVKETLFNAFLQADGSTTRKYGGTGLGLTICRNLVEMMGGEIWADGKPGIGSSFYFTIKAKIAKNLPAQDFSIQSSLKGKKVLIVDDNPSTREIMRLYVTSFGFNVTTAGDAATAIDLFEQSKAGKCYELIIMDINMAGMDGITACTRIIESAGPEKPSIIIMSSTYDHENIQRMKTIDINSFILKPIKKSSLYNAIREQFGYQPTTLKNFVGGLSTSNDFSSLTILLVEDNAINQLVASEILMAADINVIKAGTGLEAIDILKHRKVDAVLMDIQMPEMDGLEATRIIRSGLKLTELPIIAMTANAMQGDREVCLAAGMNDYIPKPIESKKLFASLEKILSSMKSSTTEMISDDNVLPDELPGIDIEAGVKRVRGNRKLFGQIIIDFKRDHFDDVRQLKNALAKNDIEFALRLSHSVKGVAGNFSAHALQQAAQNLEAGLEEGDHNTFEALLADFKKTLDEVLESASLLEERAKPEKTSDDHFEIDTAETTLHLNRLSQYLTQRENIKAEDCMRIIRKQLTGTRLHDDMAELKNEIIKMEYDTALKLVDVLSEKLGKDSSK